jgi:hypothetical protein
MPTIREIEELVSRLRDPAIHETLKEPALAVLLAAGMAPEDAGPAADLNAMLYLETDRGCALVGAAFLDGLLERMLRAVMAEGASANAVVGRSLRSFGSRIQACHALALLRDSQRDDLEVIRLVRNCFAHAPVSLDFGAANVAGQCGRLTVQPQDVGASASPRQRFAWAVASLTGQLHARLRAGIERVSG